MDSHPAPAPPPLDVVRTSTWAVVGGPLLALIDASIAHLGPSGTPRAAVLDLIPRYTVVCVALCAVALALGRRPFGAAVRAVVGPALVAGVTAAGAALHMAAIQPVSKWGVAVIAVAVVVAVGATLRWRAHRQWAPPRLDVRVAAVCGVGLAALLFAHTDARPHGEPPTAAARPDSPRLNVVMYVIDTLRSDRLGVYGYERPTSPEIDAFSADATRFAQCWAPSSWTKPSTASLMTGLFPGAHAVHDETNRLSPAAVTFAEVLGAAGWRSAGYSDNLFISPDFGYDQGFDHFDANDGDSIRLSRTVWGATSYGVLSRLGWFRNDEAGKLAQRGCDELVDRALAFIDDDRSQPFFTYLQVMETHAPYEPTADDAAAVGLDPALPTLPLPPQGLGLHPFHTSPPVEPGVRDRLSLQYDAEIRAASRGFGRLLDGLRARDLLESTIVMVVSEHGEEFLEHGGWTHQRSLHRELTHVPLIVRLPDGWGTTAAATRGRVVHEPVSLVDLMPTLLALNRIDCPVLEGGTLVGVDVSGRFTGETTETTEPVAASRPLLFELSYGPDRLDALRDDHWLLVRARLKDGSTHHFLYDTTSDPGETTDVAGAHADVVERLAPRLDACVQFLASQSLASSQGELDEAVEEHLRSIGYLGGK